VAFFAGAAFLVEVTFLEVRTVPARVMRTSFVGCFTTNLGFCCCSVTRRLIHEDERAREADSVRHELAAELQVDSVQVQGSLELGR